jgi:CHAD domain-containing protein
MRVGLRRLRGALSLFSEMLRDSQSQKIKEDLKWLTGELGPARQLHVFAERVIEPLRTSNAPACSLDKLDEEIRRRRAEAEASARAAICSERFRILLLAAAEWIEAGDWRVTKDALTSAVRERRGADTAAEILSQRSRRLIKGGKRLRDLDVRQRHKLRIAAKKLRYGAEFFAALFPSGPACERRKLFLNVLKSLQSGLGDLNDIAVHQQYCISLARETLSPADRCDVAYLAGIISGHEESKVDHNLCLIQDAYHEFRRVEPFWR